MSNPIHQVRHDVDHNEWLTYVRLLIYDHRLGRNMKKLSAVAAAVFMMSLSWGAQAEETNAEFSCHGTLGAAVRGPDRAFSFGGPKIMLSHGDFAFSASFFPSLLYLKGLHPSARPTLGVGPEISFKKIGIIIPFYYVRNRTIPYFGVSYKF